jgi:hypothetical protein
LLSAGDKNYCYKLVTNSVTHDFAVRGCDSINNNTDVVSYDVHLAYIETKEENDAILKKFGINERNHFSKQTVSDCS